VTLDEHPARASRGKKSRVPCHLAAPERGDRCATSCDYVSAVAATSRRARWSLGVEQTMMYPRSCLASGDVAEIPHVDGVAHRWVDVRGIELHVAEAGLRDPSAPVLVFLHGWPQHWWCWRKVLTQVCNEARIVVPDLRGQGWSDAPTGGYVKENLVDDLLALLDELGHDRVTLVGHDWGGWIGFLAALREPHRFEALIALGIIHPFPQPSLGSLANAWRGAYQLLLAAPLISETMLRASPLLVSEAIRLGCHNPAAIDADARRHYGEVLQAPARARASVRLYRSFLLHDLPRLGRYREQHLTVPTRLLVGRHDPVVAESLLDGWHTHATDMTVEILDDVGHFVPEEAPDLVAQLIRSTALHPNPKLPRHARTDDAPYGRPAAGRFAVGRRGTGAG
jgi:pimeloyl-ACP methyl ester carboxylesterase